MGKSYAVRVRQFMENHKVSRNLLASMTQVYPTYIARMETGEVLPTEEWWNKFFYRSNGYGLWKASGIFAYLGDEYYEWSMKCLKRSAWRQFKIAKMMLKDMKENPYKFPEA